MKPRLNMVTLAVRDLPRAVAFYERGLALPRLALDAPDVAFFTLGGAWLALWEREALERDAGVPVAAPGGSVVLAHNVSSREEVDALQQQAAAAGGRIVRAARDADWGGRVGYFADPDGHLWEATWNPHFWPGPRDA